MSIRIITDSAADLDTREFDELQVELIPLSINVGGRVYAADKKFNKNDYFRLLAESSVFPTTSQPAPADFEAVFAEAKQQGDDIVYISISSALSGTYQCASIVRELGEYDNVYLVDSLCATLGQKLLVLEAVKMRAAGASAGEIVEALLALRARIRVWAGVDTLEYLQKGGRLSKAAAGVGTLARVKPILTVTPEGTVHLAGKALGKGKAIAQIVSMVEKDPPAEDYPLLGVYSGSDENLQELLTRAEKAGFNVPPEQQFSIGPVIGTHTGPGVYGLIYIAKEEQA